MPATLFNLVRTELSVGALEGEVPLNTLILYEHKHFSENGRMRIISVTEYSPSLHHSLHTMDFKDCLSSLKWNLESGIVVVIAEHHDGGGRKYQCWGQGQDSDIHNNNFGDCASSWSWYRYGGEL